MVASTCYSNYSGGWGKRITWIRKAEVAVSWDFASKLKIPSKTRKGKKERKRKNKNELSGHEKAWDLKCILLSEMGCRVTPVIPALWKAEVEGLLRPGVWNQPRQHGKTPCLLKIQKVAGCGGARLIPITWVAEAQESLEPRRQRLQWAEIVPLHSSLG